jgi:hypothetical protein
MNKEISCEGDGKCFSIENNCTIFPDTKTSCKFKCIPKPCEICGDLIPEYVYICKKRKCVNCDINPDLFNNNNLSTTKLSLNEFTQRMNKLPLHERIERFNSLSSESTHPKWNKLYMLNFMEDSDEYKWLDVGGYINHKVTSEEKFFEYLPKKLHSYYNWLNLNGDPYIPNEYHYPKMLIHKFFEKWVHIILSNKDGEHIRSI